MKHRFSFRRTWVLARHDVRLQFRYGIQIAYAVVVLFYLLGLHLAGAHLPGWLKTFVLYTDPSVLGFFFLGALVLLERAENTRSLIAISPTSATEYLAAKVLSLTGLSLVAVSVLTPLLHDDPSWPILLLGVGLTSIAFVGMGVRVAGTFRTVSGYLMGGGFWIMPLMAPGLLALQDDVNLVWLLLPSVSQVALLRVGLADLNASGLDIGLMIVASCLWASAGFALGVRHLQKELGK